MEWSSYISGKVCLIDYLGTKSSCPWIQVRQAPIVILPNFNTSPRSFISTPLPPVMNTDSSPSSRQCHSIIQLFSNPCLVVLLAVEYPEDGKEQVDDVQVKRDSRSNLFLNVIVAHDKLGIHQDISTEYEGCH